MSSRSLLNFLLVIGVCVPPVLYVSYLQQQCQAQPPPLDSATNLDLAWKWLSSPLADQVACEIYLRRPRLFVNLVYFVIVDVGFYVIYLLQQSTWLIDPHWQIIPVCIALYFFSHPDAGVSYHPRAWISLGLLLLWAARLFHNYVRREEWDFGGREDWRYSDMRREHGRWFVLSQFLTVSIAQHAMLVGLTMPLQPAMASVGATLNAYDGLATCLCVLGISIGYVADNQLSTYMALPAKPLLLDSGLWRYSRHPNHFGEQLWWVGVLCFAVASAGGAAAFSTAGASAWTVACGVAFNHPVDTLVTLPLIEGRMLRRPDRAALYKAYKQRTSRIVPWFVREAKVD